MIPGMIGTPIPASRARRDEVEVERVVEEHLRDQEVDPGADLLDEVAQVVLGAGRRGCASRGSRRRRSRTGSRRRSARRVRASTPGRPRSSSTPPGRPGGSPRSASTLSMPGAAASGRASRAAAARSRPTQVKWAIASRPCSSRMRLTISIVSRALGASGAVGDRHERGLELLAARRARRTGCARRRRFSAGRTRTRTPARRAARISSMRIGRLCRPALGLTGDALRARRCSRGG